MLSMTISRASLNVGYDNISSKFNFQSSGLKVNVTVVILEMSSL